MKKTLVAFAIFAALCLQGNAQNLIVAEAEGTESVFSLDNLQRITFANGNIQIVQTNGTTTPFSIALINKLFFGEPTQIEKVLMNSNELVQYSTSDEIQVNCKAGETITLYGIGGNIILTQRQSADGGAISIAQLPKGIYLLRVNNQTVKISKR